MSLSEVSNILWRERQLLELLVFKLEEEQLVLASGRTRWLAHATREVETILGEIKRVELERAMTVAGAIGELGLSDAPTPARARGDRAHTVGRHLRRAPPRAAHARAGDRSDHEVEPRACCSAATRPRAKRSRRSARSTSTRTTPAARMPDRSLALRLVDKAI